ncbi:MULTISPECIES: hypothetical protein [Streptomyces]|uniref:hypothetical protein n=1 Tax=Streptomyces TaxID=1883 RepID=UPI000997CD9C
MTALSTRPGPCSRVKAPSYRKHGLLPPPDHVEGGKPYWYADTVRAWVAARSGNRTRRAD